VVLVLAAGAAGAQVLRRSERVTVDAHADKD
jgi:hypothetical protein